MEIHCKRRHFSLQLLSNNLSSSLFCSIKVSAEYLQFSLNYKFNNCILFSVNQVIAKLRKNTKDNKIPQKPQKFYPNKYFKPLSPVYLSTSIHAMLLYIVAPNSLDYFCV